MSAEVSILPPLVGGALTIAGGLVVYKLTEANRRKHFLLGKIEEIYRMSARLKTALTIESKKSEDPLGPGYRLSVNEIHNSTEDICMQLKLYFPQAKDVRVGLEQESRAFLAEIWKQKNQTPKDAYEGEIEIRRHIAYTINALRDIQKYLEKETKLRT